jgi:hypothetical protein
MGFSFFGLVAVVTLVGPNGNKSPIAPNASDAANGIRLKRLSIQSFRAVLETWRRWRQNNKTQTNRTMDLKKFITQSMVEIMTGLKDAQDQLKDSHARICPAIHSKMDGQEAIIGRTEKGRAVSVIDYNVAVEVSTDGGKAEIKVMGGVIGGGVKGQIVDAEKIATHIKFSVPVCYPEIAA